VAILEAFADLHDLKGRVTADHLCYKCGSKESFERVRELFEGASVYIYQSLISGRRIAIICLERGIETSIGTIRFLELCDQKPDNAQRDGFEHVEVYAVGRSFDDMVNEFERSERVSKAERPHHTTCDIDIGQGFLFRVTSRPLIEKIMEVEMKEWC
jgi:predicted metalloenzyme YecM